MIFVELPAFTARKLFDDDALRLIQLTLLANPLAGKLISGGWGLRKLRAPLPGHGKRGGARVIYYWYVNQEICYLVYAYAKNRQADLTPAQLRLLAQIMREELDHG